MITDVKKFEEFKIADRCPRFFIDEYERQKRFCSTHFAAYLECEKQHEQLTGRSRYSDFESFKAVRQKVKRRG
jgi:hypothetical protein